MKKPVLIFFMLLLSFGAYAVEPDEKLADPVLEGRARAISQELRCVVCQNQSIDDSHADLARDLRHLVRERLVKGDTDQQVLDFIVSRYGEFVLLRPRFTLKTWVLWIAPVCIILLGAGLLFRFFRKGAKSGPLPLDPAEQERLRRILDAE